MSFIFFNIVNYSIQIIIHVYLFVKWYLYVVHIIGLFFTNAFSAFSLSFYLAPIRKKKWNFF
jgi:hypothetical protein